MFGAFPGWPGVGQYVGPRFNLVPQAREIYEMIRKAQFAPA